MQKNVFIWLGKSAEKIKTSRINPPKRTWFLI